MPFVDDIGRTIASTRPEARQLGLTLYQGKPCPAELHTCSIRYASNGACEVCTWEANRTIGRPGRRKARDRKRAQRARMKAARALAGLQQSPIGRLYLATLGPSSIIPNNQPAVDNSAMTPLYGRNT